MKRNPSFFSTISSIAVTAALLQSCGLTSKVNGNGKSVAAARAAFERKSGPAVSSDTQNTVKDALSGKISVVGNARIAVLYYLDRPANREAVLKWLQSANAKVLFESTHFGYLDAELSWKDLSALITHVKDTGIDQSALMKLELESIDVQQAKATAVAMPVADTNTSFSGPVHSAGYGVHVSEFRDLLASEYGVSRDEFAGQGVTVAVFDGGIDMSRTDVFQDRVKDMVIGDDRDWRDAPMTLDQFQKSESRTTPPKGLEDVIADTSIASTLRFGSFSAAKIYGTGYDINGSGNSKGDTIIVAVYVRNGLPEGRIRISPDSAFGDATPDFGTGPVNGKLPLINLWTGKRFERDPIRPSASAAGIKFKKDDDGNYRYTLSGLAVGADHGIANLHMVGGDYSDQTGSVHFQGVAPKVSFIAVQPWLIKDNSEYGARWIPLARSMIDSVEAGADVLDMDIYSPGTRKGNDLLTHLLCRITDSTNVVPLMASHNYGPLPNTVQSVAQSPCVLGVGAAHSVASLREGFKEVSIDPALKSDDALQTAVYSGRGFGLNGLVKPDIITSAYGYTAYGSHMIRFNGTSGATPATSGAVALFKQAARKKGVELNFEQIKFLFQGSSAPVDPAHARDGYGFLDLSAAWGLFKQFYNESTKTFDLPPVVFTGQSNYQFSDRPKDKYIPLSLIRVPMMASVNTPIPMSFWIEYGGASAKISASWLKFADSAKTETTDTLNKDMPVFGESQDIRLMFNITDETWAALPPGDHIAIVKGLRTSLMGKTRSADFAMPITFTKGADVSEEKFEINPLYSDQYQMFSLKASLGDRLWIYGQTECQGQALNNGYLNMLVDNEDVPNHASEMMSTYDPLTLSSTPIMTVAKKANIRVMVYRRSAASCLGPISGKLIIRKTGFSLNDKKTLVANNDEKLEIQGSASVRMTGLGSELNIMELNRGAQYQFKMTDSFLVLRKHVKTGLDFLAPAGVRNIRVVPDNPDSFQCVLASQGADGSIQDEGSTDSDNSAGLRSLNQDFRGQYLGASLTSPAAGNTIHYAPAVTDKDTPQGATIEITLDAKALDSTKITVNSDVITSWNPDEAKTLGFTTEISSQKPDSLANFPLDGWSVEMGWGISVNEISINGNADVANTPITIWKGSMTAPVVFEAQ